MERTWFEVKAKMTWSREGKERLAQSFRAEYKGKSIQERFVCLRKTPSIYWGAKFGEISYSKLVLEDLLKEAFLGWITSL